MFKTFLLFLFTCFELSLLPRVFVKPIVYNFALRKLCSTQGSWSPLILLSGISEIYISPRTESLFSHKNFLLFLFLNIYKFLLLKVWEISITTCSVVYRLNASTAFTLNTSQLWSNRRTFMSICNLHFSKTLATQHYFPVQMFQFQAVIRIPMF